MKTADEFLSEGAATFKARNAVYGDNYKNVGAVMVGMFPSGLTIKSADDWNRLHIFLLGVVKQTRYANSWNNGGHADSMHDNTVYSAMLESIDEEIAGRRDQFKVCGKKFKNGEEAKLVDIQVSLYNEETSAMLSKTCIVIDDSTPLYRVRFENGTEMWANDRMLQKQRHEFSPCNDCSTAAMCTQEDHCDKNCNGQERA